MGAALETAMLDAHRAGLSVIPLRSNKRPDVPSWKQYIDDQPDLIMVQEWARRAEGFAILCGGATRLQVLDFEGRFMEHIPELRARLGDELAAVFESWLDGYFVATPGGGFHVAVHVEGDDQPGNVKLAADGMHQTLVETRGHGGYVVAAPSNGTTHPSGQPWGQVRGTFAEIAWATAEQWREVCAAISTFDVVAAASEAPPEAPRSPVLAGGVSLSTIERGGNSWIEGTTKPPMSAVLEYYGWDYLRSDAKFSYWSRPDNNPPPHTSATINLNDRLCVLSSNAHPLPVSRNNHTESFDSIDVIGCYQLGHLPSTQERVELLRNFAGLPERRPPAAMVSPAPGDGWLPDDFWEARPYLAAIRQAAWEAQRCPEGFLGVVLNTFLTGVPSSIRLEALIGGADSPLNMYTVLVGRSGAGKSGALAAARAMCGVATDLSGDAPVRYGVALRSGEGLPTAVRKVPPKTKDNPDPAPRFLRGIQIVFDEGESLAQQSDRNGSTALSTLCTAWSGLRGAVVGGVKASGDESFAADFTRVCMVMGLQFGVGAGLYTGLPVRLGFTSRLMCFATDRLGDRSLRRRGVPAELGLPYYHPEMAREIGTMTFSSSVEDQVSRWTEYAATVGVGPHDGHKMLLRMRTAGAFALMDKNAQCGDDHWELARYVEEHCLATRERLVAGLHEVDLEGMRAAGRKDMVRQAAHLDAQIEDRAERLAQFVHGQGGAAVPWRRVRDRFNGDDRKQIESIVEYAVQRNWVSIVSSDGKRSLVAGERKPAR